MEMTMEQTARGPMPGNRSMIALRRIATDLLLGALAALLALFVKLACPHVFGSTPDALFLIPAAVCAWRRGFRSGGIALLFCTFAFHNEVFFANGLSHAHVMAILLILVEGGAIVALVAFSRRRLDASEHTIGEVQQEFALLLDGVSDCAFFLLDSEGSINSWNSGAARLTLFERGAMIGQPVTSLCAEESTASMQRALELAAVGGSDHRDLRFRRSDGTAFRADVTVVSLRDDQGSLRGYSAVIRDITAAQSAEKALRESEEKYRFFVTNIPDVAWRTDAAGNTVYISENFQGVGGYKPEEMYERPQELWFGSVHPNDLPLVKQAFEALITDGTLFDIEYRYRHRNGEWIWLHDRACSTDKVDGVKYVFGLLSNVTARREEQEQLKRYKRLLADAEKLARVGSWSREMPSNAMTWSEETYRIFGVEQDAFDGTLEGLLRLIHPDDQQALIAARQNVQTGEPTDLQIRIIRTDGVQRIVSSRARLVSNPLGEPMRIVGTLEDVTERIDAEERERQLRLELQDAQRLSELGRIAANIAHEVNNVLMAIHPQAELVDRAAPGNTHVQAAATRIRSAVSRGRRITEEILRFTSPRRPEVLDIDARHWLQGIVDEVRSIVPSEIDVLLDLAPHPITIQGDHAQLQQVVLNLCSNARNAMPEGGVMTIRLKRSGSSFIEVTVADTGVGITDDLLPRIFEPLFSGTPTRGSGLGLAVARQIVTLHKGTLVAVSEPGNGSTFTVRLPCAEPGVKEIDASTPTVRSTGNCRRLLLVEDDDAVSCGIAALLELDGIEVRIAPEGGGVVEAIHDFSPDAVVLDVTLPDISGIVVYERIRKVWPDLPVIISTGQMCDPSIFALELQPHTEFLMKPYASEELLERIGRIVGS